MGAECLSVAVCIFFFFFFRAVCSGSKWQCKVEARCPCPVVPTQAKWEGGSVGALQCVREGCASGFLPFLFLFSRHAHAHMFNVEVWAVGRSFCAAMVVF